MDQTTVTGPFCNNMPLALFAKQWQRFGSCEERGHSSAERNWDPRLLWKGRKSGRRAARGRRGREEEWGEKKTNARSEAGLQVYLQTSKLCIPVTIGVYWFDSNHKQRLWSGLQAQNEKGNCKRSCYEFCTKANMHSHILWLLSLRFQVNGFPYYVETGKGQTQTATDVTARCNNNLGCHQIHHLVQFRVFICRAATINLLIDFILFDIKKPFEEKYLKTFPLFSSVHRVNTSLVLSPDYWHFSCFNLAKQSNLKWFSHEM